MKYNLFNNCPTKISAISLGTWVFGGDSWNGSDDKESLDAIAAALDHGINFIDTAPIYGDGNSEFLVGKAIQHKRSKVFLATKCGLIKKGNKILNDLSAQSIRQEIEDSLTRLKTDYIDLYQCHWPDSRTPLEETFNTLNELQKEGKILYIGVSNFKSDLLAKASEIANIISLQDQYSLLERTIELHELDICRQKNIGLITYGSLAGGILSGKYKNQPHLKPYDARSFFYKFYKGEKFNQISDKLKKLKDFSKPLNQIALNWVRQQPCIATVLVGCRNVQQVMENIEATQWDLSQEQICIIKDLEFDR